MCLSIPGKRLSELESHVPQTNPSAPPTLDPVYMVPTSFPRDGQRSSQPSAQNPSQGPTQTPTTFASTPGERRQVEPDITSLGVLQKRFCTTLSFGAVVALLFINNGLP